MENSKKYIAFNKPAVVGNELKYIQEAINSPSGISGNGIFVKKCEEWFEKNLQSKDVLLTGSCTHALEIAAILLDLKEGDEIIMPSYTFVTSANAFVLHGGTPVFVDINPQTMNIDENLIEAAITPKTRAILVVHYGGVGCNMDRILEIAKKHNLILIEDAAQALFSRYNHKPLGTFGDFGCFSFHETKNYTSGEGGAIVINNPKYVERAEIIREKGTDRSKFFRGQVDKYTWVDVGSSYVMSELNAAYLFAQLEAAHEIDKKRYFIWQTYHTALKKLEDEGKIKLPYIPAQCQPNSHIFYIKTKSLEERTKLIKFLREKYNVHSVFHYVPLHSAKGGIEFGRMNGEDKYTTKESDVLLRLPLFYNMSAEETGQVIDAVLDFYS